VRCRRLPDERNQVVAIISTRPRAATRTGYKYYGSYALRDRSRCGSTQSASAALLQDVSAMALRDPAFEGRDLWGYLARTDHGHIATNGPNPPCTNAARSQTTVRVRIRAPASSRRPGPGEGHPRATTVVSGPALRRHLLVRDTTTHHHHHHHKEEEEEEEEEGAAAAAAAAAAAEEEEPPPAPPPRPSHSGVLGSGSR
jgi:hypothetical protein